MLPHGDCYIPLLALNVAQKGTKMNKYCYNISFISLKVNLIDLLLSFQIKSHANEIDPVLVEIPFISTNLLISIL